MPTALTDTWQGPFGIPDAEAVQVVAFEAAVEGGPEDMVAIMSGDGDVEIHPVTAGRLGDIANLFESNGITLHQDELFAPATPVPELGREARYAVMSW